MRFRSDSEPTGTIAFAANTLPALISQHIHDSDISSCRVKAQPWEGYPHTHILPELIEAVFTRQLRRFQKLFVLEVGSFSGGSAIRMARKALELGITSDKFALACADTWLGDTNMITNVYQDGRVSSLIVPLRAPSIVTFKSLERYAVVHGMMRPAVIYLDSAHEPMETLIEISLAWNLLAEDGILFGDDYDWPAVHNDVLNFAYLRNLTVHLYKSQWLLHKREGIATPADRDLTFNSKLEVKTRVHDRVTLAKFNSSAALGEALQ
ncbi:hypothetical protein TSOC_006260 [Tetrabaena socialis]|uniref:Class I SAM-dependent methyltransferase n=1 Tax=Tetrabaena socialis TaxID=47790 RepID=A0A2J8A465_9CHLO|nr:hypothetical protein TSOC_006260 [Tetrabaena socialis]|eukprot:PNH07295.1 hypothetical protein TSOC_006260 [Tetrabaena socialis]